MDVSNGSNAFSLAFFCVCKIIVALSMIAVAFINFKANFVQVIKLHKSLSVEVVEVKSSWAVAFFTP